MFNWLISPTESFAAGAEVFSDFGLAVFTLVALIFVGAEYAAEHLDWPWGKAHKAIFAMLVIIGFSGELFFEMGSFRYSYALQAVQAQTIVDLETEAKAAKSNAAKALVDATAAGTAADRATIKANAAFDSAGDAVMRATAAQDRISGLTTKEATLKSAQERDAATLQKVNIDIAKAQATLTQVETTLGRVSQVAVAAYQRSLYRRLDIAKCAEALRGKPSEKVEIWYVEYSPDAFRLANDLETCLYDADWPHDNPKMVEKPTDPYFSKRPAPQSLGAADSGISIVCKDGSFNPNGPERSLGDMLNEQFGPFVLGGWPLPAGTVRLVIGPKL